MSKQQEKRKPKNKIRTREEILRDMKKSDEFIKKMKFTKEQLYPAVVKASKNVEDAKIFLTSLSNMIMQKFLSKMKEIKFSELKLDESLSISDEKYLYYKELLALFNEMNVFDSKELIEGMKGEIDLFVREKMENTKLEDLPVRWLDEI
jgi:hypothetical protein